MDKTNGKKSVTDGTNAAPSLYMDADCRGIRDRNGDEHEMKTDLPERRPTRIEGFDYSLPGVYFVTVCCQNRNQFFDFPPAKAMVENIWRDIPNKFTNAQIDVFVVMPDHFHAIVIPVSYTHLTLPTN